MRAERGTGRRLDGHLVAVLVGVVLLQACRAAGPTAPTPGLGATSEWYQLYFTEPTYPERAEARRGGIDERFVEFVDAANSRLDVAVYEFDLQNAAQALARAHSRGVRVRMVVDSDTIRATRDAETQRALAIMDGAGIPLIGDEREAIMHHKFAVRDAEEVWTGSWNMTTGDTYRLNNNAIRIRSGELAAAYTNEFEKMFSDGQFGPNKAKGGMSAPIQVGAARVQPLFAPEEGVAGRIAERLAEADASINFMAFSFTHDGIGRSILDRSRAGVRVSGVFERTGSQTRFSEYGAFKGAGLDVYQDGNPYLMHHKVFVVDGRTVVFGSFNFSQNAERDNDENCLIVDDQGLAAAFGREFERVLTAAKSPPPRRATPDRDRPR